MYLFMTIINISFTDITSFGYEELSNNCVYAVALTFNRFDKEYKKRFG